MKHLLRPFTVKEMRLPNRLVMPPMLMGYGSEDGYVTDRMIDYYEERAKGGAGLVIVEATGPRPAGTVFRVDIDGSDDKDLPKLSELAEAIKKHGARAVLQMGALRLAIQKRN